MPFTPDQQIICGKLSPSVFVLTGSGFMRGLASGRLLADSLKQELLKGEESQLSPLIKHYLGQCDPHRFEQKKAAAEAAAATAATTAANR